MMDRHLLKMFHRKQNMDRNEGQRNTFKLGDYGLSFNKYLGNLLNFGDNKYLAPELLNSSDSHFKVLLHLLANINSLDRFYQMWHLLSWIDFNQLHS